MVKLKKRGEKDMKQKVSIFISSLVSGLLISIGGLVYCSLYQTSKTIGALLFGFGLFCIILLNQYLYTGKIGYVGENKKSYLLDLLICLIGNLLMSLLVGSVFYLLTRFDTRLINAFNNVKEISNIKLNSHPLTIFVLSFFCGILIFLAVDICKKDISPLYKVMAIFLAIMIFILSGYEHCIANMFYFAFAGSYTLKTFLYLLLMIFANSVGSIFIYYLLKYSKFLKEDKK